MCLPAIPLSTQGGPISQERNTAGKTTVSEERKKIPVSVLVPISYVYCAPVSQRMPTRTVGLQLLVLLQEVLAVQDQLNRVSKVMSTGTRMDLYNNNNNVHFSCTRQRPERSHDTY